MTEFLEGSAYRHDLLAIEKSGTDFGLRDGRHHLVEDLGDGVDRAAKRGVRGTRGVLLTHPHIMWEITAFSN